jgi:hypothetical protein
MMAMRGMFNTSDLIEPLADRGINLSRSQVYRLVADVPERISISMLLALTDILGCQLTDLAVPGEAAPSRATKRAARKKAAAGAGGAGTSRAAKLPPSTIPKSFYQR